LRPAPYLGRVPSAKNKTTTRGGVLAAINQYLRDTRDGRWPVVGVACPGCGGRCIGWGWYERTVCWVSKGRVLTQKLDIKRFRCKGCGKTFGYLPWFILRYVRFAAVVVQQCWEQWAGNETLEDLAEATGVSSRTIQRWCAAVWRRREALNQTLRRLVREELPNAPPLDTRNHQLWSQYLLPLIRQYLQQSVRPREDSARPPYHYTYALK
jgi:transposase